jgi:hypothetical protein
LGKEGKGCLSMEAQLELCEFWKQLVEGGS